MVMNGRIRDLILDPERTHMIYDIVKEGTFYGMQTFDQALLALYRAGLVALEEPRTRRHMRTTSRSP
jgi:twitching motility protein PilT